MANPSRLFILRPVATSLLMTALLFAGFLAYRSLPVSALPQIDYPTIQVVTLYPGAGPEVVTSSITAPLERNFGNISGLNRMSSQSSEGVSMITLQFTENTALDSAEQEVQAAINASSNYLPSDLPNPPLYSKVNPADPPIVTLAASADGLPLTELQDLIDTRLAQKISRITGVGLVTMSGGRRPAVRIQINPRLLASYGLSMEDVRSAVASANVNIAKGGFDGPERSSTITANDQLVDAREYDKLIIGWKNDAPIYLSSLATVADSAEDLRLGARYNTTPAIILNVQRKPGANVITTADDIKRLLPELKKTLPDTVNLTMLTDRTVTTRATVAAVLKELFMAVGLVIGVMYLFLRNARATIIPGTAVPLSLVGAFAAMYFLDYSINNLTLMALIIATGFVVDDAIVVTENISRYLEMGEPPLKAAIRGSGQIAFTIISLTVSLVAVLIPLLFMGDITGRLFREFAVTLAVSILISAVVSLTLTPMMCAYLLKPLHTAKAEGGKKTGVAESNPAENGGNNIPLPYLPRMSGFRGRVMAFYSRTLNMVLDHQTPTLLVTLATLVLTVLLYIYVPKGFFPVQDTGLLAGITEAAPNVSYPAMDELQKKMAEIILKDPDVESLSSFIGVDGQNPSLNSGRIYINLKPIAQRPDRAPEIIRRLNERAKALPALKLYLQPVQDLTIEDQVSRTQYQFSVEAMNRGELEQWVPRLMAALEKEPELADVASDLQGGGEQAFLHIDRDAAARYGVTVSDVDNALYNAFGRRMISTIFTQTNQYRVILEVKPEYRQDSSAFDGIHLSGRNGTVVPLTAVTKVEMRQTPLVLTRQGQFPASSISFNLGPGASLGGAVNAAERAVQTIGLPMTMPHTFLGAAKAFHTSLTGTLWLILAALACMYIVLGVLYEHYIHPVTILSTLPSAGVGALLALLLFRMDLGIVGVIGIILLIGIVKKNAIMMIDFALDAERKEGKSPREAIHQACLLRLRPILMTTMAALFSALPMMLGSGMGAELRRPLGVTMVGGLIFSQVLTLYTTPVIYLFFDRLSRRFKRDQRG